MYSSQQNAFETRIESAVQSAMASCKNLTTEHLSQLLDNSAMLESLVITLPQVKSLPTDRETALAQNKSLAEWNIAQQPRIEQARNELSTLYKQVTGLKGECESLKARLDGVASTRSLDTTATLLQVAAQEADDDAEAILQQFQSGEIGIDLFLKQYKDKKTLAHMRKIKSDRLMALLRDQGSYGVVSPRQPEVPGQTAQPTIQMPQPQLGGGYGFGGGYPAYPNINQPSRHAFY